MKVPTLVLVVALALAGISQASASSFVLDMYQDGANVVATGSGNIDLSGLHYDTSEIVGAVISPSQGWATLGSGATDRYYFGIDGPTTFGSGPDTFPDSSTGDFVGVYGFFDPEIYVPLGYSSDDPLSNFSMWDDATASSLGITPGIYTWTWTGDDGTDTLTLYAFEVPEPSQYGLGIVLALAGLFTVRRLRTT